VAWTLATIALEIGGEVYGNADQEISGVATLQAAQCCEISFLANPKYKKFLSTTSAGGVLVSADSLEIVKTNAILVNNPYVAYAKVATLLFPDKTLNYGIAESAIVSSDANCHRHVRIADHVFIDADVDIAEGVEIGPGCVIQRGVKIGKNTKLIANVTICKDVCIGMNTIIHPGAVIGADGFGIANDQGRWIKVPQLGSVEIGDDVEIGANTTIDRGALDNTQISTGVKLDNQIQIGHNVTIGEHTVIAGCVGIAGSTHIGKNCAIGGGTGIAGHLTISDGVQLTGMSMVTKSIRTPGIYSSGIPVETTQHWHKNVVYYRKMGRLNERVKLLEEKLKK
jgi:UDP-3-O-[3-hydroxymyristoyl] glucosamine N-acyltransferase